ncbi:MAG: septation protein IspZ [Neisseriaceae bacterium]|nr:septation protein IspZ [Neisseriaceae bacterium]
MKALTDTFSLLFFFAVFLLAKNGYLVGFATILPESIAPNSPIRALLADPKQAIYLATGVAMFFAFISLIYLAYRYYKVKTIEKMQAFSVGMILVMGSATLLLHDAHFIFLKPTLLYWAMALALLSGQLVGKMGIKAMLSEQLTLSTSLWKTINIAWIMFFFLMGALNWYIAYAVDETTWFKLKIFGGMGLTMLFIVLQMLYVFKKEPSALTATLNKTSNTPASEKEVIK